MRTVDATIGFVKNVNPISRQVRNMLCHLLPRLEEVTLVEVYNEVKTVYGNKAMNYKIRERKVKILTRN